MARQAREIMVCLKNDGYEVSLEKHKLYVRMPDKTAAEHGLVRVVDESGEDFLYPQRFFAPIELPPTLRRAVMQTA